VVVVYLASSNSSSSLADYHLVLSRLLLLPLVTKLQRLVQQQW